MESCLPFPGPNGVYGYDHARLRDAERGVAFLWYVPCERAHTPTWHPHCRGHVAWHSYVAHANSLLTH